MGMIGSLQCFCCCCPWLKGRDNRSVRDQLLPYGEADDSALQRGPESSISSDHSMGARILGDNGGAHAQVQQRDSDSTMAEEALAGRASLDGKANLFRSRDSLTLLSSDVRASIKPGYLSSDDEGG